jgi:hypothetical protein
MRTKLAAPLLGLDAADHLDGVQYEITDGFARGVRVPSLGGLPFSLVGCLGIRDRGFGVGSGRG